MLQAQEATPPPSEASAETASWQNDLDGFVQAQIRFAQTHVIDAPRKIFDPLLVPSREALVVFEPHTLAMIDSVNMIVQYNGNEIIIPMAPPAALPENAVFDQENVFSGRPIVGNFPRFTTRAFTVTLPPYLVLPGIELKFVVNNDPQKSGTLNKDKMVFLNNESEGLVLMNIKGCLFKPLTACRTTLDQWDMQKNPQLAKIAAREMFSELPVKQLILGMGESYWPYVIARGPDGRPHRYSTSDRNYREWATFGDKTLPAKLGMGNYWRAASALGDKRPGQFVAISGQLLDVPDDIPVLPPGVGASCGGNSCNYPHEPAGFWHETGHGLGLPHDTPPRYEGWAWRGYDLRFLPNTHPNPSAYGLGKDHLDYHYFGHVLGTLNEPAWPGSTASAPLIDEFEQLRREHPANTADWKHYIAPYTHQQMLRVQQRFGSFPEGLQYAKITDDHRQPPGPAPTPESVKSLTTSIDTGIADVSDTGHLLNLIAPDEEPVEKGVAVHTLVLTMGDRSSDAEKITQIYPPIISNYGNVFAPSGTASPLEAPSTSAFADARIQSAKTGKCLSVMPGGVGFEFCLDAAPHQRWTTAGGERFRLRHAATLRCLDANLQLQVCADQPAQTWGLRRDMTNSDTIHLLQNVSNGKFITPGPADAALMEGVRGSEQYLYAFNDNEISVHTLQVRYVDGSVDDWVVYPGAIPPGHVITAAINVPSSRKPVLATLSRNGQVIDSRMIAILPALPTPITVGGEAGYPVVIAQYLRSEATGKCLARTSRALTQQVCNAADVQQQWGVFDVLSVSSPAFILTGLNSTECLYTELEMTGCLINFKEAQWRARKDLAHPEMIMLQNGADGRFITAAPDGTVSAQGLTQGTDQNFRRTGPAGLSAAQQP